MKWIKGTPNKMGEYIFNTKTVGVKIGYLSDETMKFKRPEALIDGHGRQFTHYMIIPEPPKEIAK